MTPWKIPQSLTPLLQRSMEETRNRLQETTPSWFPHLAFLSSLSILVLSAPLAFSLNYRLGHPIAHPIMEASPHQRETTTWLAISFKEGKTFVTTTKKQSFSWKENPSFEDLEPFVTYLKDEAQNINLFAGLAQKMENSQAILAVDRSLTYGQCLPVLHALAAAGFSDYAWEVILPLREE